MNFSHTTRKELSDKVIEVLNSELTINEYKDFVENTIRAIIQQEEPQFKEMKSNVMYPLVKPFLNIRRNEK